MLTLDEDGKVVEKKEIDGVMPEEADENTIRPDYDGFADLYVDPEEQAQATEEPGDDEDDDAE